MSKEQKKSHAKYGPSTLGGLYKCVRYKFRQTDSMTDAADEGVMIHRAIELNDYTGLTPDQKAVAVQCRQYGDGVRDSFGPGTIDELEVPVTLVDRTYGTPDRCIISPDRKRVIIIDHKAVRSGTSDFTQQLKTYLAARIEMLILEGHNPESGACHVIAPRIDALPDIVEYPNATQVLTEVRADIDALYERIADPFHPPTTDADLCAKCSRASVCPALNKVVETSLIQQGITLPTTFDTKSPKTPVQKSIMRTLAKIMENWAELVGESQKEDAVKGVLLPGYRIMSKSNGVRVPKENTYAAFKRLQKLYSDETIIGTMSVSIGALATAAAEIDTESVDDHKADVINVLRGLSEKEIIEQSIEHPEKADELRHQGDLTTEGRSVFYQKAKAGKGNEEDLLKELLEMEAVANAKKIDAPMSME